MDAKRELCRYFESGATPEKRIGIELEHFVIKPDGMPLEYYGGVEGILSDLAAEFDRVFYEDGSILGMVNDEFSLTLEPGAQLEVSICPMDSVDKVKTAFDRFYRMVTPVTEKYGARLVTVPAVSEKQLDGIGLIPKKRYEYMDNYFKTSGTMGRYMMRGTASAQVSVDYCCEADFVRKFRAAYLLSPLFALLLANGEPGSDMYLKRIEIWDNVDEIRTSAPPDLFDEGFGFASYAGHLLSVPAIFVPQNGGYVYTGDETIASLAKRLGTDGGLLEHYLSMVFPDVRLKNYIEIRITDSVNAELAAEYGGLVMSVMYNDAAIDDILSRYAGVGIEDIKRAKKSVRERGVDAAVYGRSAREETAHLFELAGTEIGGVNYDKK